MNIYLGLCYSIVGITLVIRYTRRIYREMETLFRYCLVLLCFFSLVTACGSGEQTGEFVSDGLFCDQKKWVFTSQAELDSFSGYPCSTVGSLKIKETVAGDIIDLSALSGVTKVLGDLQVFDNTALEDLSGLDNLFSVGGNVDFFRNEKLSSLHGLEKLTEVGGFLDVSFSDYLHNIDALAGLQSVGTKLRLFHLYGLHDCKGIEPIFSRSNEDAEKILVGAGSDLPRNGTGANSIEACINSAKQEEEGSQLAGSRPNVILFLMDDVGIDQLGTFGFGGINPPTTPGLDAIAAAGIKFTNVWAMPECSPSRVTLITGDLPMVNNVTGALGPKDLANSQLSPYQQTLPKLLRSVGYTSALVGKWHMAGPEYNSAEYLTPLSAGFDYFLGNIEGFLRSVDTTAGGVAPVGTYSCGFVPNRTIDTVGGADYGACYSVSGDCVELDVTGASQSPGRACMESGGLFDPLQSCALAAPNYLDFNRENAYYVAELEAMSGDFQTPNSVNFDRFMARGYRTQVESDAALDWLSTQKDEEKPYFLLVSYSAAHTPLQQVPESYKGKGIATASDLKCDDLLDQRLLQSGTISVISEEILRVLTDSGLVNKIGDSIAYTEEADNTLIIILGDNGSLGPQVRLPFDGTRAKGTAYQTGVRVPLIVAGPDIRDIGVDRAGQTNIADIYALIIEAVGLPSRSENSQFAGISPLRSLDNAQTSVPRHLNAANARPNLQVSDAFNPPCELAEACTTVPTNKGVCEDNNGTWWGANADGFTSSGTAIPADGFSQCWMVNEYLRSINEPLLNITPTVSLAVATESFKYVESSFVGYDETIDGPAEVVTKELFQIMDSSGRLVLDREIFNLLSESENLTDEQKSAYGYLSLQMESYKATGAFCREDGNRDGRVDELDVDNVRQEAEVWAGSSRYDVNIDGLTNRLDIDAVISAQGQCDIK